MKPIGVADQRAVPEAVGDPAPAAGAARRWLVVAGWVAGCLALTALFVRISMTARVMSDGDAIALQSWDVLHGHLLLHGWQVSDLNCYFIEIPIIAVAEALFGLGNFAQHVGSSITYMLVTVVALAAAVAGSRGPARVIRGGVVLAVLAAPILAGSTYLVLEEPDHIGTSVLIVGSFVLIDRWPAGRFTAPLLLVILTAGQFDDRIVLYTAVPAIVVVCATRAIAARSFRSPDAMLVYATLASVPLSALFSKLWVHIGGFVTPPPWLGPSPVRLWPHHVLVTWQNTRILYGAATATFEPTLVSWKTDFGLACLLAAVFGFAWVVWQWRRASRAELMIVIAIICSIAVYVPTAFAYPDDAHDLALLLPCGAILAARALVPARIRGTATVVAAAAAAALVAALPLAYAATRPSFQPEKGAPLLALLDAHHLTYGIGSYDDGPTVSVLSHGKVQIAAIHKGYDALGHFTFEAKEQWYDPRLHYANFVVAKVDPYYQLPVGIVLRLFGKPVATYKLDDNWIVLVYHKNLLKLLTGG